MSRRAPASRSCRRSRRRRATKALRRARDSTDPTGVVPAASRGERYGLEVRVSDGRRPEDRRRRVERRAEPAAIRGDPHNGRVRRGGAPEWLATATVDPSRDQRVAVGSKVHDRQWTGADSRWIVLSAAVGADSPER